MTLLVIINSSFFTINFVLLIFESETNIRIFYSKKIKSIEKTMFKNMILNSSLIVSIALLFWMCLICALSV